MGTSIKVVYDFCRVVLMVFVDALPEAVF